jgi:hypothetical protein
MTKKIRVDVSEMTLRDMAETQEVAGDPDGPGFNFRQTAALAWLVVRRTDPTFTYEQALDLKISDLDIVEQPPEVLRGDTGAAPPMLAALGTSVPST